MSYISLQALKNYLDLPHEEAFFSEKDSVLKALDQRFEKGEIFIQGTRTFSGDETARFISELKDQSIIVYDQWVWASQGLKYLLTEERLIKNDIDKSLHDHFLFPRFKTYLTPFLSPLLNRFLEKDPEKYGHAAASYIPLMTEEGQFITQDKIVRFLDQKWEEFNSIADQIKSPAEFNEKAKYFFLPERIGLLNDFTKAFYVHKVAYIERAIALFEHPAATAPFVLWITNQLKQLELNPEHAEKVKTVHDSVMRGEQNYFKAPSRVRSLSIRKAMGMLAILCVTALGIYFLIRYKGFTGEGSQAHSASAFSKFTKEERMQLDSLIRSMEKNGPEEKEMIDQVNLNYLHLTPVQVEIETREPLRNGLAEQYVQDCIKAFEISSQQLTDTCIAYPEDKIPKLDNSPFLTAEKLKGSKPLLLKNESDYQVQVLLFEESGNEVYTAFLTSGQTLRCSIDIGYRVILIPGGKLGKAELPKLSGVSKFYKHHFCFMDGNYLAQLFQVYRVKDIAEPQIKILLNATPNQQLYLVDLYEALEMGN